jgi:steroid delta-isomerase-like uncharacterized protein
MPVADVEAIGRLDEEGDRMATQGQVFENPQTGDRIKYGKTARDTGGLRFEIEFFLQPNPKGRLGAHLHPYFDERFEFISGHGCYIVGKDTRFGHTGDVDVLPRGIAHVHPFNVGLGILHVRKITQLDTPEMQWLLSSEALFETLYALAQQRRTGDDGLPTNLLEKVVVVQALQPAMYGAGIPISVQGPVFGILAAIGRALGFRAYSPAQYLIEPGPTADKPSSEVEDEAVVRRFFADVLNACDPAAADRLVTQDAPFEAPTLDGQPLRGLAAVKQYLDGFFTAFPDVQFTLEELFSSEGQVAARFTLRGTHRATFLGMAATGRTVAVRGVGMFRIEGGSVADARLSFDVLGLVHQLGTTVPTLPTLPTVVAAKA